MFYAWSLILLIKQLDYSLSISIRARAAERTRGARGKILFGAPMMSLFSNNKTNNRWTVPQSVENTYKRGL